MGQRPRTFKASPRGNRASEGDAIAPGQSGNSHNHRARSLNRRETTRMSPFKKLRTQTNATQRVIADRAGKTIATVWNWENYINVPPLTEAGELATVYETTRAAIEQAIVATSRKLKDKQPAKAGRE